MLNPSPTRHSGAARQPFYFNSSAHLLRIGRQKASNLSELLQALRSCPDDSIFQHTFRTLEEHHFIPKGFSNDFAHWAFASCDEPALAERLAGVDVREFTSLADLRARIVEIVEEFTRRHPRSSQETVEEPFYFCAAEIVVLPTPFAARNLAEFADALARVSVHSIHHHFIEARLRLKLSSNDFSLWLQDELGLPDAARRLNRIDIYTATLEDVRRQIIYIVERALA
ncbi:MAG: DUF5752 family protein [Acidobacteriia bacterium]|nr:DUF5752 family protein [Terriglobia bacterium]